MARKKLFRRYISLAFLVLAPACGGGGGCHSPWYRECHSSLPAGTSGGCCMTGRECGGGLVCTIDNVCEPCGGEGQDCCESSSCNSGLVCETDYLTCGNCGEPGERCCANGGLYHTCNAGAVCEGDMCVGAPVSTGCDGSIPIWAHVDSGHGCTSRVPFYPTEGHSVEDCASMMGLSLVDVEPDPFHFCAQSPLLLDPTTFEYFATSEDNARMCAMYVHSDHTEWMDGCCPGDLICGE